MALVCYSHIPPELLRHIFLEVIDLQHKDSSFVNTLDTSLFPWVPARVCRQWRLLCLADWNRDFWTDIRVNEAFAVKKYTPKNDEEVEKLRESNVFFDQYMSLNMATTAARFTVQDLDDQEALRAYKGLEGRLEAQLEYAGDMPLTITMDVDTTALQVALFSVLWPHRARWKQLRLESICPSLLGDWDRTIQAYLRETISSEDIQFPLLASLCHSYSPRSTHTLPGFMYISETQIIVDLFQQSRTPALTEAYMHFNLALCGPQVHGFAWEQLQVLELLGVPSSFIRVLTPRIGPNLRELQLRMADANFDCFTPGPHPTPPPPTPCTTFPSLTSFKVNCLSILKYIHAPVLHTLFVERRIVDPVVGIPGSSTPLDAVVDFIHRSGCSLRDFTLLHSYGPVADHPQQLCAVLHASPELKSLRVSGVSGEMMEALGAVLASGLCPDLERLDISGVRGTLRCVMGLVVSRSGVEKGQGVDSKLRHVWAEETRDEKGSVSVHRTAEGLWSVLEWKRK